MRGLVPFCALLFTTLAMAPAAAHLLELANKMRLGRDEYLTVQQIYRGWALLGLVIFGALASNLALVLESRPHPKRRNAALVALLSVVGAQVVFWVWTYPTNVATRNWTVLPEDWERLRRQWEYSHAAGSVLMFVASLAVFTAVLLPRQSPSPSPPSPRTTQP